MEKTIKIDGHDITLEAKASNLMIYASQFGEDCLPAMGKVVDAIRGEIKVWDVGAVTIAKLTWTMAKTHNADFPDFNEWFNGLESFPVIEVFNQIAEMVSINLITKSDIKPKNTKRAGN